MATAKYGSLFQAAAHAKVYATFRPSYPKDLYEAIAGFIRATPAGNFNRAIDIACGSGQGTVPLASYFDDVRGVDISAEQVANATQHPKVKYMVGAAETVELSSGSVDLITVAQGAHWFDLPKFFAECDRLLAPNGSIAIYGYGNCILQNYGATHHVMEFCDKTLGPYWADRRAMVDNAYRDIHIPYKNTTKYFSHISRTMTVQDFGGYLGTWSAYQTMKAKTGEDPLPGVISKVMAELGESNTETAIVQVTWPLFALLGKKD